MSELSRLGPESDDLHRRAQARDEMLRRRIEQGGIPVDHGIREEITPEQREEWAERTRRHMDEEDKIIEKMRGRIPPTTKSFSGLLKSLRAKYGIKAVTSDEGETLEDDPRDWEDYEKNASKSDRETTSKHTEQSRTRTQNAHDEMERFFGDEKSYSMQVPIPHGNLSKTNVPPVSWKPGLGAVKALSELASYFKTLSDEKTFGQTHREKAMELLQKASAWDYFKQMQKPQEHQETPAINRVYSTMSEGIPAFDPNPAGPPVPERNPTQEEIWNQIVKEAEDRGAYPAFDPRGDNPPYAEKYTGVSAMPQHLVEHEIRHEKMYLMKNGQYGKKANGYDSEAQDYLNQLVDARRRKEETALRFADTSNNYDRSQHELRRQRRYGESFPGAEKEATETGDKHRTLQEDAWVEDYTAGDTLHDLEGTVRNRYLDGGEYDGGYDLTESARKQVEDEPKKALSVLCSFFKNFYGIEDTVQYVGGDPNDKNPTSSMMELQQFPVYGVVSGVRDYQGSNESFGKQELSGVTTDPPGQVFRDVPSHLYAKIPPQ